MSVEAISWALNLAPVPADRRGQPSSACKFVLVGLANHAGPDGSGAFPSVATLVRYTGLSERTVRTCLDRLEAGGIIRPCDPDLVAARIKRADRRPQGWDLDLTLARDDLNEPGVTVPESQSPVRWAGLAPIERPHHERPPNGVQPPHLAGLMDHLDHEVQQLHLAAATRCNQRTGGVQPTRPRGAAVAPEPSRDHP
jgi:Helix-turn-helix domain